MQAPYYRTFIGMPLEIGGDFRDARNSLIRALSNERISWVSPENFHVTLRFLGDTETGDIHRIRKALRDRVSLPTYMEVRLLQLGSFGPNKRPRVVWVGFEDQGLFETLKIQVDGALDECGIHPGNQPFRPHLTLGRIRSLQNTALFYRVLEEMRDAFRGIVHPSRLVYFRSVLESGGPRYISLEEIKPAD
jgi:2'-5' RNA ligase